LWQRKTTPAATTMLAARTSAIAAADTGLNGLGAGGKVPVGTDAGDTVGDKLRLCSGGAGGSHDAEPETVGYSQERQLVIEVLPFWGL
jgi:hypothetical protein